MAVELGTGYVSITSSAKGLDPFERFQSAKVAAGNVGNLGKALTIASAAGAIVGNVVSDAFNAIASSMSGAIARTDTMANFPKVMSSLGFSSDEASAAVQRVAERLDGLPSSTADITSKVQQLAATTGNLGGATDIALAFNDAMLAGGQGVEAANRAFVQYNQMLSAGKVDMQSWNSLVVAAPAQMDALAKSLLGASANQKTLYNALKDGTVSFDDFNRALVELDQNGSGSMASFEEQARSATQGIGTAMENVQNRIQKAIEKIIEAVGAANISSAINSFSASFGQIADVVVNVINGIKDTVDFSAIGAAFQPLVDVFSGAGAAIAANAHSVGEGIGHIANFVTPAFAAIIQTVADALNALGGLLAPIAGVLGAVAAGFAGLQIAGAVSGVVSALGAAFAGIQTVIAAGGMIQSFSGLGAVIATIAGGPIPLIIAGIAALIAGFIALYQSSEDFRNGVSAVLDFLSSTFGPVIDTLIQSVTGFATSLGDTLRPMFDQLGTAIQTVSQTASTVFGPTMQAIGAALAPIVTIVAGVANVLFSVLGPALSAVAGIAGSVFGAAFNLAAGIISAAMQVIGGVIQATCGVIQMVIGVFVGIFTGNWKMASDGATAVFRGMSTALSGIINGIVGFIGGALNAISSVFSSVFNGISGVVSGVFGGISNTIGNVMGDAKNVVSGALNAIAGFFSGLHLEFPHINLPHFWVRGGEAPWGIGGMGSMPSFGVDWYARGGIVPRAAVLGEAGAEAIVPYTNSNIRPWAAALSAAMGDGGRTTNIYVDGAVVNGDEQVKALFMDFMSELSRLANMNVREAVAHA